MTHPTNTTIMQIVHVKNIKGDNRYKHFECSICYKSINKKMVICNDPCCKVFHIECLMKTFQSKRDLHTPTIDSIINGPKYRCCYCQRITDIDRFFTEMYADLLITMKNSGRYDVTTALINVIYSLKYHTDWVDWDLYNEDYVYLLINKRVDPNKDKVLRKNIKNTFKRKVIKRGNIKNMINK